MAGSLIPKKKHHGFLSNKKEEADRLGRRAALTVAVMVVGQFWQSLSDTEEQLEKTALASDKLGEAESILGSIFDLTTGKIKEQNPVLLANARAKIALAKIDAARELAAGKADMRAIRRGRLELQAGLGGGLTLERVGDNTQGIIDRFMRGVNTYSQALSQLQNQLDTLVGELRTNSSLELGLNI